MNKIRELREKAKMKQSDLGLLLNVKEAAISKYETGKVPLTADTIIKLSEIFHVSTDYLLGRETKEGIGINKYTADELDGPGITDIIGCNDDEEKAVSFSNKLALQIDYNGSKLADVANAAGVTVKTVLEWLYDKRNDYPQYYEKLSEFFNVEISYWTRPGAVSPGIEPTTQECYLIERYRCQYDPDILKYLPIEDFFPNCHELSELETKWLDSFRRLNESNQYIIIGDMQKYIKEQRYEDSVAADSSLRKTGTDNLGK